MKINIIALMSHNCKFFLVFLSIMLQIWFLVIHRIRLDLVKRKSRNRNLKQTKRTTSQIRCECARPDAAY